MFLALRMKMPIPEKCRGCADLRCWERFTTMFNEIVEDPKTMEEYRTALENVTFRNVDEKASLLLELNCSKNALSTLLRKYYCYR